MIAAPIKLARHGALLLVLWALFLAGCASTPAVLTSDRRTDISSAVRVSPQSIQLIANCYVTTIPRKVSDRPYLCTLVVSTKKLFILRGSAESGDLTPTISAEFSEISNLAKSTFGLNLQLQFDLRETQVVLQTIHKVMVDRDSMNRLHELLISNGVTTKPNVGWIDLTP